MTAAKKLKVRSKEKIRILVCDDDGQASRRMVDFLSMSGFECRSVSKGSDAKRILFGWKPRVVIIDMLFPELNAFALLHYVQNEPSLKDVEINTVVISSHNTEENVKEAYRRGAVDYMARPILYQDLLGRIVFHCREKRDIEEAKNRSRDSLKIADLIMTQTLQTEPFEKVLYNLTQMAALRLRGLRCSIIRQITFENGCVLASSDKYDIAGLSLDLKKYPEVQLVINTGKMVVVENLEESKALAKIKLELRDIHFNSLVVCPIYCRNRIFGVLSMRMPPDRKKIEDHEIQFLEFLSKAISLYLGSIAPADLAKYGPISA